MSTHVAWTADVPGVGELEEHDPGDYEGRHRRGRLSVGVVYYSSIVGRFRRWGGSGGMAGTEL